MAAEIDDKLLEKYLAGSELTEIEIKTAIEDNHAKIEIKDNGSGIPQELLEKIFIPNFSTKSSGMGLGLAIAKNIIDKAGGSIWFITKAGEGTTFFIRLPLWEAPREETVKAEA